jgi:hypothetical protein
VPLSAQSQYTLSVPACGEGTTVAAYAVGLCASTASVDGTDPGTECTFGRLRTIRAYMPGVRGIQRVAAVTVDDLDDWEV